MAFGGMSSEPSLIEFKEQPFNLRFLITEAPKDTNLHVFIKLFKKHNVSSVVRISEPRYRKESVEEAGISLFVSSSYTIPFICNCSVIQNCLFLSLKIVQPIAFITFLFRRWYLMMELVLHPKSYLDGLT